MKYEKCLVFICLLICLFSIASVAASEVNETTVSKDIQIDNIIEIEDQNEDNVDNIVTESQIDLLKSSPKTFSNLNTTINGNNDSDVYLDSNYKFDNDSDSNFKDGIIINRSVTIHGNGYTIDGNNSSRIFLIATSNIIFKNITFTNAQTQGSGGAIFGTSTVINCLFINNYANYGGAIAGSNAINCTFTNNSAKQSGGAIVGGNAEDCIFNNNTAQWFNGGAISEGSAVNCTFNFNIAWEDGGAIYKGNAVNCTFNFNTAKSYGGAIRNGDAINCSFINNSATYDGGALAYCSADNCIFINNSARDGGAMWTKSAFRCTFIGNTAKRDGGATSCCNIFNSSFINNSATRYGGAMIGDRYIACESTFINNSARSGGALYQIVARNCVFTNNFASFYGGAAYNSVIIGSIFEYNKAKKGGAMSGTRASNCTFNHNSATKYGGAVYDAKVSTNSKFNNNFAETGNDTYEVTFFEVSNSKSFTDLSILINGYNESDIYLDCNYTYDINIDTYMFLEGIIINRAVTIHGNGFTIDGFDIARIFKVTAVNYVTVFKEINFANGYASDYRKVGGAISGEATAINCTFISNSAKKEGGATCRVDSINCTFINNSADNGGAAYFGDLFINCTFVNNTANYDGSAVYGLNKHDHNTLVENCTIINIPYQNNIALSFQTDEVNCTFIDLEETFVKEYKLTVSNITSTYGSSEKLLFNFTNWDDEEIIDAEIKIRVYREDGALVKGDYVLSGEDWFVSLDAGNYTATLNAQGYRAKEANASITINKIPSNVSISIPEPTYGENITVYVTASVDGRVTLWLNGYIHVNVKANIPTAVNLGVLKPMIHRISASFEDKNHLKSRDEKRFDYRIKLDESDINISIPEIIEGQKNTITVSLPKNLTGFVTLNYNNENQTIYLNKGIAQFTIPAVKGGVYPYTINYTGCFEYLPFTIYDNINVKFITVKAKDMTISYGSENDFIATFYQSNGSVLSNESVLFIVNNEEYSIKTDSNGVATLNIGLSPGTYKITLKNIITNEVKIYTLIVKPIPIDEKDINIPALPSSSNGHITVKLPSDATGTITLKIGGNKYKFEVINGVANVKMPNLVNGAYSYSITYSGDGKYSSFTKTGKVTINNPVKTTLTLKKVKVKRSAKKLIITAKLKVNGKAVKGKTIKFKFNKKTYKAKTNKKGIAKITVKKSVLKKLKAGKKVKYQATYGKITKKIKVKVKK